MDWNMAGEEEANEWGNQDVHDRKNLFSSKKESNRIAAIQLPVT